MTSAFCLVLRGRLESGFVSADGIRRKPYPLSRTYLESTTLSNSPTSTSSYDGGGLETLGIGSGVPNLMTSRSRNREGVIARSSRFSTPLLSRGGGIFPH